MGRVDEVMGRLTHQLVLLVAQHSGRGRVDESDAALGINSENAFTSGFQYEPDAFFGLPKRIFSLPLWSDVSYALDGTSGLTGGIYKFSGSGGQIDAPS